MPSRRIRQLYLSRQALNDLQEIYAYGVDNWGLGRSDEYLAKLEQQTLDLLENPFIGKVRQDIGQELRSLKCGRHLIVYRVCGRVVEIARILHERQDPSSH
ncbi:type II toxin-antitoxin system RelE/ParE family toxin [Parahaliea maris]|uniref:Toxin n=1 Tax=Parahaliea maris TaxID=2716870 RepID=A0A5C8ZQR4_9GAMM|nr:type II toxin-antitoxin system RelE/ParE family toxin [Parahaliea maris]